MNTRSNNCLLLLFLMLAPAVAHALFNVTTLQQPTGKDGVATLTASLNENDATLNPCYQVNNCELRFILKWGRAPGDSVGTLSLDEWGWSGPSSAWEYRTLGEFWKAVTNKNRTLAIKPNNIWPWQPGTYCGRVVTVHRAYGQWVQSTPDVLSNCSHVISPLPTCRIEPEIINVSMTIMQGAPSTIAQGPGVYIYCERGGELTVRTNNGEVIPLGGSAKTRAILDWGDGFGRPMRVRVPDNGSAALALRVKTEGLESSPAGRLDGSAIVRMEYY
ncbi:hypothetical protein ADP72_05180 [Serratia plymuthica]|nr:hypothetical protein ADP72_05180 [Serratia plymuthica]